MNTNTNSNIEIEALLDENENAMNVILNMINNMNKEDEDGYNDELFFDLNLDLAKKSVLTSQWENNPCCKQYIDFTPQRETNFKYCAWHYNFNEIWNLKSEIWNLKSEIESESNSEVEADSKIEVNLLL